MTFGPLTGKPEQRVFSTYDLEWTPAHSPEKSKAIGLCPLAVRLIGCFDGHKYRAYTRMEEFLRCELVARNSGRWYYAHAGGLYDIQFVLEWVLKYAPEKYRISAALSASSAIIVKIERGRHHWTFIDSFWLMRTSLRKIGDWVGMKKGGAAGNTDVFWAPLHELIPYNEMDCQILWHAISQLEAVILSLGGELQKTAASTAMNLFRRAYLKREITTSPDINDIGRLAYVASRVEPFATVAENACSLDINSSFPFAMLDPVPGNFIGEDRQLSDSGLYLAEVTVTQPESRIPVLPIRLRKDNDRVYFPTGTWRGWYCADDVRFLEETGGRVEQVHRCMHFEPFSDFADYARDLYERRRAASDVGYQQILKILLNSLYGKTAERTKKTRLVINPDRTVLALPDYVTGGTGKEFIRPGIWQIHEDKEIQHAHVPIATTITAVARRTLGRHMLKAPELYYVDTDSLCVPQDHSFELSDELGGLKYEKKMGRAHFAGPKLYAWCGEDNDPWSVKAKGFSKITMANGENRPMGGDDYWQLVRGEPVRLSRFTRVRELCGMADPHPAETVQEKRLQGKLRPKRCLLNDGSSRAWTMNELDGPAPSEKSGGS